MEHQTGSYTLFSPVERYDGGLGQIDQTVAQNNDITLIHRMSSARTERIILLQDSKCQFKF